MEDAKKALGVALRLLHYRWRTVTELRLKLEERGFVAEEISKVLEFLKKNKLLDDKRYARSWIRQRSQLSPRGKFLLKRELSIKGISEADIEAGFSDLIEEDELQEDLELAIEAGRRKLRVYKSLPDEVFNRRMSGFLARRGFGYGVIKQSLVILSKERYTKDN